MVAADPTQPARSKALVELVGHCKLMGSIPLHRNNPQTHSCQRSNGYFGSRLLGVLGGWRRRRILHIVHRTSLWLVRIDSKALRKHCQFEYEHLSLRNRGKNPLVQEQ